MSCHEDPSVLSNSKQKPHPVHPVHPSSGELVVTIDSEVIGSLKVKVKGVEEKSVQTDGTVSFELRKGLYEVELLVESGVIVVGENPQMVEIMPNKSSKIVFKAEIAQEADMGQIIFSSDRTGFWEIFAMDSKGENIRQITNFGTETYNFMNPAISPDGNFIVFKKDGNIFKLSIDGDEIKQLTEIEPEMVYTEPSWSADGSKIVFVRVDGYEDVVFTVNADGTDLKELPISAMYLLSPCFSPDGNKVLFVKDYDVAPEEAGSDIYIANIDGSDVRKIIDHQDYNQYPRYSPDGSKIAFVGDHQIFIANADGTGVVKVTQVGYNYQPAWSPDGLQLIYRGSNGDGIDLFAINIDGSNIRNLTNSSSSEAFPTLGTSNSGTNLRLALALK
ncbi:MAG: DPP IV N-terminal domain-containing protein [Bacteroidota bacterium]|nr:DPP IV N-terminal domain-containing protein [Bacteroidota bacterium]